MSAPVIDFPAEAWSYFSISCAFILLRIGFQLKTGGWRRLAWDDFLMVLAACFYAGETSAAYMIFLWMGLANNNMTDEARAALDPNSEEWAIRVKGSKMNVVGWMTYTCLFWLLKCCWTIYYSRMTDGVNRMDVRIKLAWGLIGSTFIACLCIICFRCWPFEKQWQIYPNPGTVCQPAYSKLQVSFIMACNTITDLYLMAIPIPIIWKAHLSIGRKISLLILFSMGWIVIIFAIIRCVLLVTTGEFEMSSSGPWSVRESFVAILVSNSPIVFPLFKSWFISMTGLASTLRSGKSDSYQLDSHVKNSKGSDLVTISKEGKKKRFQHPLSIPKTTAWGSDEEIVTMDQQVMGTGGRANDTKEGSSVGDRNGSLDVVREEALTDASRNNDQIGQSGTSYSAFRPDKDIMVTKQWEVDDRR